MSSHSSEKLHLKKPDENRTACGGYLYSGNRVRIARTYDEWSAAKDRCKRCAKAYVGEFRR